MGKLLRTAVMPRRRARSGQTVYKRSSSPPTASRSPERDRPVPRENAGKFGAEGEARLSHVSFAGGQRPSLSS